MLFLSEKLKEIGQIGRLNDKRDLPKFLEFARMVCEVDCRDWGTIDGQEWMVFVAAKAFPPPQRRGIR